MTQKPRQTSFEALKNWRPNQNHADPTPEKSSSSSTSSSDKPASMQSLLDETHNITSPETEPERFEKLLEQEGKISRRLTQIDRRHPEHQNQPKPTAQPRTDTETDAFEHLDEYALYGISGEHLTLGEPLSYRHDSITNGQFKKLRRGQYRIDFTIDLHGFLLKDAEQKVHRLLNIARADGCSTIRIIHGKGKNSGPKGPVIKAMLDEQLRHRDDILAFCSAPAHDGGTGVLYCLLKQH